VLLYVPGDKPPFDLYDPETRKGRQKLYVRRVYIADDARAAAALLCASCAA
jgi:molecular chaperone HtpG